MTPEEIKQLQAKVAELEDEREGIKQALTSDYYFSGLPIAYSVRELVAGYKDRNKSANVFMQQLNEMEKQNAELTAEVERLSVAHVKACQANADSQTELSAAQEEIQRMKRERLLTADAIESMHASHKGQLAKAEQRVAEAFIEYMVDLKQQDFAFTGSTTIGIEKCETAIRSGEYRKFMKEK